MNITTNYQLKTFNYARLYNQTLQTNPSFGNKHELIKKGARVAAGVVTAGTTAAAMQETLNQGLKEFLTMLENKGCNRVYNEFIAGELEKYPEIVAQYAHAKDNKGNYRFSSGQIYDIVIAIIREEYSPEKVYEFMNLQRPDGSYVNDEFYWRNFEIFMKNPKEYEELCNILIDGDTYIYKDHIENIITHYINYPKEIKEILEKMPRFSTEQLTKLGTRAGESLHIAPKSFKTLARLHMTTDEFAFSLEEICDIIKEFELDKKEAEDSKEFKAILKKLSVLGKHRYDNYGKYLSLKQIFEAFK